MNVTCLECSSLFRVDPDKVPPAGVLARCSVCGGVIAVDHHPAATPAAVAPDGPGARPSTVADVPAASDAVDGVAPAPAAVTSPVDPGVTSAVPDVPVAAVRDASPAREQPPAVRVGPRRVNPYLSNDPAQRARRLARALVSDLVAYHPEKREEGLRAGTLKELFRDDIRKSWREYVDQVGAPTAENTPHFQEALNDILAGGRRVF